MNYAHWRCNSGELRNKLSLEEAENGLVRAPVRLEQTSSRIQDLLCGAEGTYFVIDFC